MSAQLLPINLPILGLNTVNPFIDPASGYARELTNYALVGGALRVRPSVRVLNEDNGAMPSFVHFDLGVPISAIGEDGNIWNVDTAANIGTIGGFPNSYVTLCKYSSLDLIIGARAPRLRAYPFTAWTITPIAIVATSILAACGHNGRLYYTDGATIEYTDIGQIAGAVVLGLGGEFPISQFLDGQTILRMFSVSINPGNAVQNVLAIFGSAGKVLVFAGAFPGSPDWELIGNYNMPQPTNGICFTEIDGDIFVGTWKYPYWFKDLINGNPRLAYDNSPGLPIENLWAEYAPSGSTFIPEKSFIYYLDKLSSVAIDAVVCQFSSLGENVWANYQNEAGCLVFFRKYKAWALWLQAPFFHPVIISNVTAYYGTEYGSGIVQLDAAKLVDQWTVSGDTFDIPVETSWKTPYYAPYEGQYQETGLVRCLFKNTDKGYVEKIRIITDYADFNSPYGFYTQSTVTQINPQDMKYADGQIEIASASSNLYNVPKNIGVTGQGFSVQITQKPRTGSSATQEQGLLPASVYVKKGGVL